MRKLSKVELIARLRDRRLLVLLLLVAVLLLAMIFGRQSPTTEQHYADIFLEQQSMTVEAFWQTLPKPSPPEKKIVKQTPPPPPRKLNINDLIISEEATVDSALLERLEADRKLRETALAEHNTPTHIRMYRMEEKDDGTARMVYMDESKDTVTGFDKITATYPIDLSRVLVVTSIIPAVLITEIKSEVGSDKVMAQVEQDIYAFHGNRILIPKGTKAIGKYKPLKKVGDTKITIEWYRMVRPDGINIQILGEVADMIGGSGITGEIDHRWKERYGQAALFATISAAAQLSVPAGDETGAAAAEALTNNLGTVTAAAVEEGLGILPTVRIKRGERILISPLSDIVFKPAKGRWQTVEPLLKTTPPPRNGFAGME